MTVLAEACSDLQQWLPRAAALIAEPDIMAGTGTRTAPGSRPPWNADAADLTHEITAGLADIEAELRQAVTGTIRDRPPYRSTGRVLAAISALGSATDAPGDAARVIQHWVTRIMTMPAIDATEVQRPVRVRQACPFCKLGDLRMVRRDFDCRITCLRLHQCHDTQGDHPRGLLEQSRLDGQWRIYWNDGTVT